MACTEVEQVFKGPQVRLKLNMPYNPNVVWHWYVINSYHVQLLPLGLGILCILDYTFLWCQCRSSFLLPPSETARGSYSRSTRSRKSTWPVLLLEAVGGHWTIDSAWVRRIWPKRRVKFTKVLLSVESHISFWHCLWSPKRWVPKIPVLFVSHCSAYCVNETTSKCTLWGTEFVMMGFESRTFHIRATILPAEEDMPRIMDSFKKFNNDFMCQFRDSDNILPRLWGSAAIAVTIAPKLITSQKVSVNTIVHVESITTLCMSTMCTYDQAPNEKALKVSCSFKLGWWVVLQVFKLYESELPFSVACLFVSVSVSLLCLSIASVSVSCSCLCQCFSMDTFSEELWSNCSAGNPASRTAPNLPVSSLVSQWSHLSIRFIWQESVLQWSQLSIRFIWQESVPTHFQIIHASFYGSLRRWRSCLAQ